MAHYNLRQFDEAQSIFQTLSVRDPFRVDNMDVFSNILYVKEMFAALSFLAHRVSWRKGLNFRVLGPKNGFFRDSWVQKIECLEGFGAWSFGFIKFKSRILV